MRKSGSAPAVTADGGKPYLNASQISEWLKCRYRWHLGVERHIQSRATVRAPELGSMVHAGMAASVRHIAVTPRKMRRDSHALALTCYGLTYDAVAEYVEQGISIRGGVECMPEEELQMFYGLAETAAGIVAKQLSIIDFDRYETVSLPNGTPIVELPFTMKLPPHARSRFAGVHGTVDWVLRDLELRADFNADFKVRKAFTPPEAEEINLQQTLYQRLLTANGINTDGTIMFQIKAQSPREPEVLKSGKGMSRAAIVSDWDTYQDALCKHGFDPEEYREDMVPKLNAVEWNRVEYTYRSPEEAKKLWEMVILPVAVEIGEAQNRDQRAWHFMACNGCWARSFCVAEVRGEDLDFLLETQYIDMDNPKVRTVLNPDNFVFLDS